MSLPGNKGNGGSRRTSSYSCPKCEKIFSGGEYLKEHLLSVHDSNHPYQCGICTKRFASVSRLVQHSLSLHEALTTAACFCVRCRIQCASLKELEVHADTLHVTEDAIYMKEINKSCRTFACMICHKSVSCEKNLRRHIKQLHGENARSKQLCYMCNFTFNSLSELQVHNTNVHPYDSHFRIKQNFVNDTESPVGMIAPDVQQLLNQNTVKQTFTHSSPLSPIVPEAFLFSDSLPSPSRLWQQYKPFLISTCENLNSLQHNEQDQIIQAETQELDFSNAYSLPNVPKGQPVSKSLLAHLPSQINSNSSTEKNHLELGFSNSVILQVRPSYGKDHTTENVAAINIQNISDLQRESVDENDISCNTVSEAFSTAMKTLSDFYYDDMLFRAERGDYLCAALSVFQSNHPLPNFHHPDAVQLGEPCVSVSPVQALNNQSLQSTPFTNPSASYPCTNQVHTNVQNQQQEVKPSDKVVANNSLQVVLPSLTDHAFVSDLSMPVQAKRGRPKKKNNFGKENEEYGAQKMILKESDDGVTLKFHCTVCNATYDGMNSLMHHVESVHLIGNPHECCICHKRFAQAGNVKRHIRFVHLRERPFNCRDCDSTFDRLCYLQRHMRSHIDSTTNNAKTHHLNPCNCPECGKLCLTARHLRGHMQRKHFAKNKKRFGVLAEKYGHLFGSMDDFGKNQSSNQFGLPLKQTGKTCNNKAKSFLNNTAPLVKIPSSDKRNSLSTVHDTYKEMVPVENTLNLQSDHKGNQYEIRVKKVSPLEYSQSTTSSNLSTENQLLTIAFEQNSALPQSDVMHADQNIMRKSVSLHCPDNSPIIAGQLTSKSQLGTPPCFLAATKAIMLSKLKLKNFAINSNRDRSGKLKPHSFLQYKCQYCPNRRFFNLSLLKSHIAIEHHCTTHRHLCLLCGYSYSTRNLLVKHVNKVHCNTISRRKKRVLSVSPLVQDVTTASKPVTHNQIKHIDKNEATLADNNRSLVSKYDMKLIRKEHLFSSVSLPILQT